MKPSRAVGALLGLALLTLIGYWLSARSLANVDPFAFSVAAREYWNGKALYSQIWVDRPLVSLLFYLVPNLFAAGSYEGLQVFLGFWVAVQALIFYRFARRGNERAAWVAAAAYLLLPFLSRHYLFASANVLANPFVLGLLLIGTRIFEDKSYRWAHCAGIGLLCGLLAHSRQNAVVTALVPLIAMVRAQASTRDLSRGLGIVAACAVGAFSLLFVPVALTGDLAGYLDLLFAFPRRYSQFTSVRKLVGEAGILLQNVGNSGIAALAAVFYALAFQRTAGGRWFLGASAAVAVFLCMTPVRWFPHYWASLLPFVAFAVYHGLPREQAFGKALSSATLGYLVFNFGLLVAEVGFRRDLLEQRRSLEEVSRAIRPLEKSGDTFYAMGNWSIYLVYRSSLPVSQKYFWDNYLGSDWEAYRPTPRAELVASFLQTPPSLLAVRDTELVSVDTGENARTELIWKFVGEKRYEPVLKTGGWTIFRSAASH